MSAYRKKNGVPQLLFSLSLSLSLSLSCSLTLCFLALVQVMKAKFQVIAVLAERAAVFGRKSASMCLPALVDKLGDLKVKAQSVEVLLLIAKKLTLNYTSLQVCSGPQVGRASE